MLKFKRLPKKQIPKAFDVNKLKNNAIKEQYQVKLSNRFEDLAVHEEVEET